MEGHLLIAPHSSRTGGNAAPSAVGSPWEGCEQGSVSLSCRLPAPLLQSPAELPRTLPAIGSPLVVLQPSVLRELSRALHAERTELPEAFPHSTRQPGRNQNASTGGVLITTHSRIQDVPHWEKLQCSIKFTRRKISGKKLERAPGSASD